MDKISINSLINDRKIGLYRVGYKDKEILIESINEARDNGTLEKLGLSYSIRYEDNYIVFVLHKSMDEWFSNYQD